MGKQPLSVALCVFILVGCPSNRAGETDGGLDAGNEPSLVEACERLTAAYCQSMNRCFPAFQRLTLEDCVIQEMSACLEDVNLLGALFSKGSMSIEGRKLEICEERLTRGRCPPGLPPKSQEGLSAFSDCSGLRKILKGMVPSGSPCADDAECQSGSVCIKSESVCQGSCAKLSEVGEPCGVGCVSTAYCVGAGTSTSVCRPLKKDREYCLSSDECLENHYCDGACRALSQLGERCLIDPLRVSTCEPGLTCDFPPRIKTSEGRCVLPRQEGEPCQYHFGCAPGLVCVGNKYANFPEVAPTLGVCSKPLALGAPCQVSPFQETVGDECLAGAYCDANSQVCSKQPMLGQECTPSAQPCLGRKVVCKPSTGGNTGICTNNVGIGQRCSYVVDSTRTVTIPCSSGYCDATDTLNCRAANKTIGQICKVHEECVSNRCVVTTDRTMRCAPTCQ